MNRMGVSVVAMLLCACGTSFAEEKQAASKGADEAANAARVVVEQGLAAVERMDADGLRALCSADVVGYDIDLENKPVRFASSGEAAAYIAAISAEAKKMGAKFKFENTKYDCRAASDMAYCLLEYDFVATTADGTRMVQPTRTTVALRKSDGAWKWVHWHSSLSGPAVTTTK